MNVGAVRFHQAIVGGWGERALSFIWRLVRSIQQSEMMKFVFLFLFIGCVRFLTFVNAKHRSMAIFFLFVFLFLRINVTSSSYGFIRGFLVR